MTADAHPDDSVTRGFEEALAATGEGQYVLRLYLTGSTSRSIRTVEAVKTLCEHYLAGRYDLEVVDLYQQPERADSAQIIAAPTLVKELPLPLRRLVGDLTNPDRLLIALNLRPDKE